MEHDEATVIPAEWAHDIDHESDTDMPIGDRIKQLRKEHGWSQAELGERIGTDSQRVSRYENGRITPSLDALVRIAEALDISTDYLVLDTAPRRPLHSAENLLGDRLHAIAELDDDDRQALLNVIDGLIAKTHLKALAGKIS